MVGVSAIVAAGNFRRNSVRSVLLGIAGDPTLGLWNSFLAWWQYRPERHYMRGRPAF